MNVDDIAGTVAGYLLESERYLEALMQEPPLGASLTWSATRTYSSAWSET